MAPSGGMLLGFTIADFRPVVKTKIVAFRREPCKSDLELACLFSAVRNLAVFLTFRLSNSVENWMFLVWNCFSLTESM